jgi:hypothetical protein
MMSSERLAARAARFGTSDEKAKLAERAERFNIAEKPGPKDPMQQRIDQAKKREEQAADRAAAKARATRFGLPIKLTKEEENDKKRARAERFAPSEPNKKPKTAETE